jgi:hypothetical protein
MINFSLYLQVFCLEQPCKNSCSRGFLWANVFEFEGNVVTEMMDIFPIAWVKFTPAVVPKLI